MEERGDAGGKKAVGDEATPAGALHGFDFGQVARHVAFAAVVGAVGAGASIVLSLAVDFAGRLSGRFPWLLFALPVLGIASILLYRLLRLPVDLATDTVVGNMRKNRRVPAALTPGILLGTCLTVAGGGSVGKEAAVMQMGASLGSTVGRPFRLRAIRRRRQGEGELEGYAAACGMAAAFSALFFAPIGSTVFVLELMRFKGPVVRHAATMLLASFVAFAIARPIGIGDVIPKVALPALSWDTAAACLVVGLACAGAGALFAAALNVLRRLMRRRVGRPVLAVLAGGLLIAGLVLALSWQRFEGTGMPLLQGALAGTAGSGDFAVKALLTVLALGFGFKGGEIMPMFTIGALLGCALGQLTGASAPFLAAVGMAAFFAAASRCPFAAFLMGAEIFGLSAVPFLAVGVAAAYLGSRDFGVFGRGLVGHLVRLRERTYALALRHEDDLPLLRHEGREPAPQSQGDGAGVQQREDGGRTAAPRR